MADTLLSVGLDVGTTTTQLIFSRLTVENRASGFAVPEMEITGREILYRSPVAFTPLQGKDLVDGEGLCRLVQQQYDAAGILREEVDTGAVIITGETSRKENAATVLSALSSFAGEFVVATAGPDLESVLAAKGAGAVAFSERTGKRVLHMDIGGGTSNLALIEKGKILRTGCFNVGGRLLRPGYASPVLRGVGETPQKVIPQLVACLEMAAGLRLATDLMEKLSTEETGRPWQVPEAPVVLSFSGGVADCMQRDYPDDAFGDIGPMLGRALRESRLCKGEYRFGEETVGATVIGAGCHSTRLSGSTVFYRNISFPLRNLPVEVLDGELDLETQIRTALHAPETQPVLMLPEVPVDYARVKATATAISGSFRGKALYLCMAQDMAKALGNCLSLLLPEVPILCLDRVRLRQGDYLDVGQPVGPAVPVVVKTLVLQSKNGGA